MGCLVWAFVAASSFAPTSAVPARMALPLETRAPRSWLEPRRASTLVAAAWASPLLEKRASDDLARLCCRSVSRSCSSFFARACNASPVAGGTPKRCVYSSTKAT